jgi:hypothetical protein
LLHVVLAVICFLAVKYLLLFVCLFVCLFFFFFHHMAPRKYESRHQKLKKKKRIEKLIESQKGALEMQQEGETEGITKCNKVLRDIAFNLIAVGRNTISTGLIWFF